MALVAAEDVEAKLSDGLQAAEAGDLFRRPVEGSDFAMQIGSKHAFRDAFKNQFAQFGKRLDRRFHESFAFCRMELGRSVISEPPAKFIFFLPQAWGENLKIYIINFVRGSSIYYISAMHNCN